MLNLTTKVFGMVSLDGTCELLHNGFWFFGEISHTSAYKLYMIPFENTSMSCQLNLLRILHM